MATVELAQGSAMLSTEDDMTDDQMQAMLEEAAARLRQNAVMQVDKDQSTQFKFPRLETGAIAHSYVTSKDGVAHLDPTRRMNERDWKLSNQIRKVEDPVVVSNRKAEVRKHPVLPQHAYEEDNPNFSLEQSSGTVLVAFLHY